MAALGAAGAVAVLSHSDDQSQRPSPSTALPAPSTRDGDTQALAPAAVPDRPEGGIARVGVWGEPDPAAPTLGGAAVRELVLPHLFVARPDGRWEASLALESSDRTAPDRMSATFGLRPAARWSDGSPITIEDLRRSADKRFVAGIDGPLADGTITVRFTQALPGWRRLWSGVDSVAAPRAGVWGGPFVVAAVTPGLEAVLTPNPHWWGRGPFLAELHLVLVPDPTTEAQLFDRGELDVVMPQAATARIAQLRTHTEVEVATSNRSGWWLGLQLSPKVSGDARGRVVRTLDRAAFLRVLMRGEAFPLHGFVGGEDATWRDVRREQADVGKVVLSGTNEHPMIPLLERAMQKRARAGGGELELRNSEADRVEGWLASGDYEAVLAPFYDGPVVCWTCRWGTVDAALAAAADAGNRAAAAALQAKVRDEDLTLPIWRPITAVAWRGDVHEVVANGYALSGAWNAQMWWRSGGR